MSRPASKDIDADNWLGKGLVVLSIILLVALKYGCQFYLTQHPGNHETDAGEKGSY